VTAVLDPPRTVPADDLTRREIVLAGTALALGIGLAGCGGDDGAAPGGARSVVDDAGRRVDVPLDAARIVGGHDGVAARALAQGVPLIAIATRGGRIDEGITAYFEVDGLERLGDPYELSIEAVAALRPDLILHEAFRDEPGLPPDQVARLEEIAPVLLLDNFLPLERAVARADELFGPLATVDLGAERARFERALDALRRVLGERWREVTAAMIFALGGGNMNVSGPTDLPVTDVLDRMGVRWSRLTRIAAREGGGGTWYDVPLERIPDLAGDLLVVDERDGSLAGNPLYENLPAVRAGQVVRLDRGYFGRHYPNYIAVAEKLAEAVGAIRPFRTDLA
jgi:ABC-type Fe3+-hydroxamate transport system substrate-binding protein